MAEDTVIKKIKELQTIKPRLEWLTLNRDILLAQIKPQPGLDILNLGWRDYSQAILALFRQRLLEPVTVMLFVERVLLSALDWRRTPSPVVVVMVLFVIVAFLEPDCRYAP